MSLWLFVDVNNLAWRAFHVFRELEHIGVPTGVAFGFLRDLSNVWRRFRPDGAAFCFDCEHGGIRAKECPSYKAGRRRMRSAEDEEARCRASRQIVDLRRKHLPALGFRNVFMGEGLEADDLVASLCKYTISPEDEAVIVSNDRDLWQCLAGNVSVWNGKKRVTLQSFHQEWGIPPRQWADVKAIAGCASDDVRGIAGVGEKSAAQFLRGGMKHDSQRYRNIRMFGDVWRDNLPLVRLPYAGTPVLDLVEDCPSPQAWRELCGGLGMETLAGECPFVRERGLFGEL